MAQSAATPVSMPVTHPGDYTPKTKACAMRALLWRATSRSTTGSGDHRQTGIIRPFDSIDQVRGVSIKYVNEALPEPIFCELPEG